MGRVSYRFDQAGRFAIEDYNRARPFASFLPGVAGLMGVPLWAFYVNRAQGIASFGVQDKNSPIVEYFPANRAYQLVSYTGFRTFVKVLRKDGFDYYEPFSPGNLDDSRQELMLVSPSELEFASLDSRRGLAVNVLYFTPPNEPFAALVRRVTIQNISTRAIALEVLDGLPAIVPYGLNQFFLKEMGHTAEAWMGVFNLENGVPFYRLRSSMADSPEVETVEAGHFYLAFVEGGGLLTPIVDPWVVFGSNTSLSHPDGFLRRSLEELEQSPQATANRTPCGFFGVRRRLEPGVEVVLWAVVGHAGDVHPLNGQVKRIASGAFLAAKRRENADLIAGLTDPIATQTSSPLFDAYCRQSMLDNVLRGGTPLIFGDMVNPRVYHVYSRKHGDLERDYNFFSLAPEFYSQGNGNYRDVNQNRRDDVRFWPEVRDFDIATFVNLIQPDGYNPLVILGSRFVVPSEALDAALAPVAENEREGLARLLTQPFRPGQVARYVLDHAIHLSVPVDEFLANVLACAEQMIEAAFGEGYWVDHWVYNLDLIESFLAIYPDEKESFLFGRSDYTFFDSPARVLPRADKYVLVEGQVRQLGAVVVDKEKEALIASRSERPNVVRVAQGRGDIYTTTLFAKLVCLASVKFATLDPWGMGIEMEAEKPGWYDALNGLPGMLGSSMCETYELRRLLRFLLDVAAEYPDRLCSLPVEVSDLLHEVEQAVETSEVSKTSEVWTWEQIAAAREVYRARVHFGFDGRTQELSLRGIGDVLTRFLAVVDAGIARARDLSGGLYPTYFRYEVEEYEPLSDAQGRPKVNAKGQRHVRALRFRPITLPLFLEGFAKALKMQRDAETARAIYRQVRESGLFDRKLKMYKVNASLADEPVTLGRARAFTPGWLENESIWLHMEYKYLLELLRAGLYEEFFQDLQTTLVPFLDPAVYGRSPLENSSFIVSSAHPDETLHGAGFVARLTGATAEFLSIWHLMMAGERPFFVDGGELCLALRPVLPGWLFDTDGCVTFHFLGRCTVTYHNPERLNTFADGVRILRIVLQPEDGGAIEIPGGVIRAPHAALVRAGKVRAMNVFLGR